MFPLQNAAGLLQMTMVHVCQQFTVVAPWLGLRPHSRGGCIIVTGFSGCAVKQFHAVNRKCNRLRVSILVSSSSNLGDANPRTSSQAVALPRFCLNLHFSSRSSFNFILVHMALLSSYGSTRIFGLTLDHPGKSLVVLGYYQ